MCKKKKRNSWNFAQVINLTTVSFNNSLLQLLQEKKTTNSTCMYCILFIFMFHSSALSKLTPLEH